MMASNLLLILIFSIGYLAIILEYGLRLNKSAVALLMMVLCWSTFCFEGGSCLVGVLGSLNHHLSEVSQILFFLLGAMTLVELIDSHKGFHSFVATIKTPSRRQLLWTLSLLTFFLSAVLDNLTTTILMISILRKLLPQEKERFLYLCIVVVAANAGGAWTPIGDVTTTMLWIGGQVTTFEVIRTLITPSLLSLLIPLLWFSFQMRGTFEELGHPTDEEREPGSRLVFYCGMLLFLFVPLFKAVTGLPPFMGMLISLAIMWVITDILHYRYEQRHHLRVPHILTKIDVSSILFFLGILLSVSALERTGLLAEGATWLSSHVKSEAIVATAIGCVSAIIDNVPLVAATMGMYPMSAYPPDSPLWLMIAYAAGTGGSLLVMGSSAGVALMGMERVTFFSYFKKMTLPVAVGYLAGMALYVALS
ncbi:MAG: sodium:proton antiporter NhaD [Chlamydiota bacterium]|nr:sodium:proton antiporter NhaD [Chlamydiota bacterium]